MIFKQFKDLELSALGFGTMRLPVKNGNFTEIDQGATEAMVDFAMKNGVNYYDTAWGYHDGESEKAVGRALAKYPRTSFFLATKFPGYDLSNMDKAEEIFETQLKKCGVSYFDFYLIHNVCEMNIDSYLNERFGILKFFKRQKDLGRIRHLGFSAHGDIDVIQRFLDYCGRDMEFCQLQINYLDWTFQNSKEKTELLDKHNIPVWVMEPLRGGRLARLGDEDELRLKSLRPDESVPAWAFRFLQGIPQVTMILSGMSTLDQVKANVEIFKESKPLDEKENSELLSIAGALIEKATLPCTSCRYCTSHCPKGLDIPSLIKLYNEHSFTGGGFLAPMALKAIAREKWPSACAGCKSCEKVCPQKIEISKMMKDFSGKLKIK